MTNWGTGNAGRWRESETERREEIAAVNTEVQGQVSRAGAFAREDEPKGTATHAAKTAEVGCERDKLGHRKRRTTARKRAVAGVGHSVRWRRHHSVWQLPCRFGFARVEINDV
jgi:hypothetical protein